MAVKTEAPWWDRKGRAAQRAAAKRLHETIEHQRSIEARETARRVDAERAS